MMSGKRRLLPSVLLCALLIAGYAGQSVAAPTVPNGSVPNGSKGFASAAYDPANERYLLVYEKSDNDDRDIWARFVDSSGNYLASEFPISPHTPHERQPAVAYDSVSGHFLAVWQDYRNGNWDIYGQLIDGDTVTGKFFGGDAFAIADSTAQAYNTAVAFDEGSARFLVIWHDDVGSGNKHVYGQFVNSAGSPSFLYSVNFPVSTVIGDKGKMAVASDPVNDRFMAVWQDYRSGGVAIYGQIVDSASAGDFLFSTDAATNLPVSTGAGGRFDPDIVYNSSTDRFTAVWGDDRGAFLDIYGQFLDPDTGSPVGTSVDTNFPISTAANHQGDPAIAVDTDGDHLVVFRTRVGNEYQVFGQFVNDGGTATGTAMDANFMIAEGGSDSYYRPGVVSDTDSGNFLVYYDNMTSGGSTPFEVFLQVEGQGGGGGGGGCNTAPLSKDPLWPELLLMAVIMGVFLRRRFKVKGIKR